MQAGVLKRIADLADAAIEPSAGNGKVLTYFAACVFVLHKIRHLDVSSLEYGGAFAYHVHRRE